MTSFDDILKKKKEAEDVTPIKQDKTDLDSTIRDIEAHLDKKQLPFFEAEKKEDFTAEEKAKIEQSLRDAKEGKITPLEVPTDQPKVAKQPVQPVHPLLQKPFNQLTRKERQQLKKLMKKRELPLDTEEAATTEKRVFPLPKNKEVDIEKIAASVSRGEAPIVKIKAGITKPIVITIIACMFFVMFLYYQMPGNPTIMMLIYLIGITCFLPIGIPIGWLLLDPYMRCKLLRKTTRRNYGVVNMVARGKKIISRVKNFDNDLIWVGNKVWAMSRGAIYDLEKYQEGNKIDINPDAVISLTSGVPVLFIDSDSMKPLSFDEPATEIKPEELGATLKGWVYNQLAKNIFLKKTMETFYIIVIVLCVVAAYFGYQNQMEIENLTSMIETLSSKVSQLIAPHLFL